MDDTKNQITDEQIPAPTDRPTALQVYPENIPGHLQGKIQWVLWVYQWRPDKGGAYNWTKVPQYHSPDFGTRNASSTDPATWMTFERAVGCYLDNPGSWDGIGYVLVTGKNLVGIDLDHCLVGDQMTAEAKRVVDEFDTYAELSPGGHGVRLFCFGPLPPTGRKRGDYEIYNSERFVTVTGHRVSTEAEIRERPAQIAEFHRRHIQHPDAPQTATPSASSCVTPPPTQADEWVLQRARTAKNYEKFRKLWAGQWREDYPSQSEADSALMCMLAFWTRDADQLDRLFRSSGLMRPKWADHSTYGNSTIWHALERVTEFYVPKDHGLADSVRRLNDTNAKYHQERQKEWDKLLGRSTVTIEDVTGDGKLGDNLGDQGGPEQHQEQAEQPKAEDQPEDDRVYRFRPLTSAQMADTVYTMEWLVHGVLVKGQPTIIGGPKKSLKTNSLVDLCVSLGTGTPFLGEFKANRARVCFVSGESGGFTIKETALRVCKAKGVQLRDVDCLWDFRLPKLAVQDELAELAAGLKQHGVQVVIIDPLYLCLLSGAPDKSASNLFDMGPLLMDVSRACLAAGAMPILVHHSKKTLLNNHDPLELEDLAFGGVQEFARQWLLLSRREKFVPGSGRHQLWLASGGSVGHGGLWAVDIDEGIVDEQFGGRKWDVDVKKPAEVKAEKQDQKRAEKEAKEDEEELRLQADYLKVLDDNPDDVITKTYLKSELGWRQDKFERIHRQLLKAGVVVVTSGPKNSTRIARKRM